MNEEHTHNTSRHAANLTSLSLLQNHYNDTEHPDLRNISTQSGLLTQCSASCAKLQILEEHLFSLRRLFLFLKILWVPLLKLTLHNNYF
jgi:hypothetical protein